MDVSDSGKRKYSVNALQQSSRGRCPAPARQKMGTQPNRRAHSLPPAPVETVPLLRINAVFERLARLERNGITGLDFHRLTGLRVFAGAGAAVAL